MEARKQLAGTSLQEKFSEPSVHKVYHPRAHRVVLRFQPLTSRSTRLLVLSNS